MFVIGFSEYLLVQDVALMDHGQHFLPEKALTMKSLIRHEIGKLSLTALPT
jgi:hypothetical protein